MARTFRRLLGLSTLFGVVACSFIVDTDEIDSGCASGTKYCDGRCVDVNDASYGCTSEGCDPCETDDSGDPIGDRYIPKCERGECVIDRCVGDYGCAECDKHLLSNDQNCGTCMHACETGWTCSYGECVPPDDGADGSGGAAGETAQPTSTPERKPTL
jgi:hypothetical protein